MSFNNIPIHSGLREEIEQILSSGRIPHASLFVGVDGGAQFALAFEFAKSLLCLSGLSGMACGKCSSCRKAAQMSHPDIHFSFPLNSSTEDAEDKIVTFRELMSSNLYSSLSDWILLLSAENSVLNIHAKECMRIERVLSMKSFEGRGKVLVIWLAEFLGNEGNKLLKTIEEPEGDTRIILVSCNQKALLPTIVSRCRIFKVGSPSVEALGEWLESTQDVKHETALNVAAVSEGVINEAIKLSEEAHNSLLSDEFLEWLRLSFKAEPIDSMNFIESFLKTGGKEKIRSFFRFGIFYFNQVIRAKYKGDFIQLNDELSKSVVKISALLEPEDIEKIVNELENYLYFIDRFANTKILLTKATLFLGTQLKTALSKAA